MGVILGLAAALLHGGSDFAGGLASRKLGALPVNKAFRCQAVPITFGGAHRRISSRLIRTVKTRGLRA
jgi:hypothetical protein